MGNQEIIHVVRKLANALSKLAEVRVAVVEHDSECYYDKIGCDGLDDAISTVHDAAVSLRFALEKGEK